jgi:hypothetical protein
MRGNSLLVLIVVLILGYLVGAKYPDTGTTVLAKVGL